MHIRERANNHSWGDDARRAVARCLYDACNGHALAQRRSVRGDARNFDGRMCRCSADITRSSGRWWRLAARLRVDAVYTKECLPREIVTDNRRPRARARVDCSGGEPTPAPRSLARRNSVTGMQSVDRCRLAQSTSSTFIAK